VTGFSGPVIRPTTVFIVLTLFLALAVVGLWRTDTSGAATSKVSVKHTCQVVAATLADGPDPDVDPVGYALAQVLPLQEIKTGGGNLKKSIDRLSSAYETFYKDNGATAAKRVVANAAKLLNTYCPGAAS